MQVEVAYALPQKQWVLSLTLPPSATVRQAIEASGILQQCPDINLDNNSVGIFSQRVSLDSPVHAGDRIEIYRQLVIDPKTKRRLQVASSKTACSNHPLHD